MFSQLFNLIKKPVTVFSSADNNAPVLTSDAGSLKTLLKACLVTGYGDKAGAGWMLMEDTDQGIKAFNPPKSAETDFYVKVSNDTGQAITVEVMANMTNTDDGKLLIKLDTEYKYAQGSHFSGRWLLLATERTVYFLCEQSYELDLNKSGSFLFVGDTMQNAQGNKAVLLSHSGGTWDDGAFNSPIDFTNNGGAWVSPKFYEPITQTTTAATFSCLFDGKTAQTDELYVAPIIAIANKQLYQLAGVFVPSSGATHNNFDIVPTLIGEDTELVVFAVNGGYHYNTNFLFDTKRWAY